MVHTQFHSEKKKVVSLFRVETVSAASSAASWVLGWAASSEAS